MIFKKRRLQLEVLEQRRLLAADISLIRYFETWGEGTMNSTDPAGITYRPDSGRLYVADAEIDELSEHFEGNNLFEVSLSGDETFRRIPSGSSEPTGITYNEFDGYFYITNDNSGTIQRYDGLLNSSLTMVRTRDAVANAGDPEGITSDPTTGTLYVVDGRDGGMQILVYDSDLQFQRRFSIADEMSDGEGIAFDPISGNLFIISARDRRVAEYQVDGVFIRTYDFGGISPSLEAPAGLAFAPTSDPLDDPSDLALYIADGMTDNFPDGRIFETVVYRAPPDAEIFRARVAAGSDDAEERTSGWITTDNSDLELVEDGAAQTVAMRFGGIAIPPGASILNAYLQFQTDETSDDATALVIQGERADDAATFSTSSGNISSRPRTSASVAWSPPAWDRVGEATLDQRTPGLASIVQEIVDRPGWVSGNALALIITGSGSRVAESFDGKATAAPLLHIEFTTPAVPINRAPQIEAGPDQTVTLPNSASLLGTVSDDGLPGSGLTTFWSQISGPGSVSFADASQPWTTASFSLPGAYVLRLTGGDGELTSYDDVTISVAAETGASESIDVRVASSKDDAEERVSGWITTDNADLELVYDGGNQTVGVRFTDLNLPAGATILNAYVQFQTDEVSAAGTALVVQGENVDHATGYSTAKRSISTRERTTASVDWVPSAWDTVGEAGEDQRTPDLSGVLQEIVNRPGWLAGNALALIITGAGARVAESYDGDPAAAPLLHVEYATGAAADAVQLAASVESEPSFSDGAGAAGVLDSNHRLDINRDGLVSPLDALLVINRLNRGFGSGAVGGEPGGGHAQHTWDVNQDQVVSPLDALLVLNYLNRQTGVAGREALIPVPDRESVPSRSSMELEATDAFFFDLEDSLGSQI